MRFWSARRAVRGWIVPALAITVLACGGPGSAPQRGRLEREPPPTRLSQTAPARDPAPELRLPLAENTAPQRTSVVAEVTVTRTVVRIGQAVVAQTHDLGAGPVRPIEALHAALVELHPERVPVEERFIALQVDAAVTFAELSPVIYTVVRAAG